LISDEFTITEFNCRHCSAHATNPVTTSLLAVASCFPDTLLLLLLEINLEAI
jgi:hypothetical protein